MTNIQQLAVAKVPDKVLKAARASVTPGTYPVNFTVHVKGTVTIGKDTQKAPTVSIPLKAVVGLLLQRAGATREASKQLLLDVMTEALKAGEKGEDALKIAVATVDEAIDDLTSGIIAKLPKTPVKGPVDVDVETNVFEIELLKAA